MQPNPHFIHLNQGTQIGVATDVTEIPIFATGMRQFSLLFLLFIAFAGQVHAYQVRGKVTDTDGIPIPYANVYLKNSTNGVITNVKGEYFLELPAGSHTLIFSSLGYSKKEVEIIINHTNQVKNIVLSPAAIELETINVSEKRRDPAYAIMQKVIANKRQYIKQFDTYSRETYLKASLEVDTLNKRNKSGVPDSLLADKPKQGLQISVGGEKEKKKRPKLNLIESEATTYFAYPNKYKSIVHAYRDLSQKKSVSGGVSIGDGGVVVDDYETEVNNPYLFYLDASDAEFNFYENLISVLSLGDRPFISPLSATSWRLSYKYKLEETFYENGRVIYKIRVTPRNSVGPFFEGSIFIVDQLWAIKSVNFRILPGNLSYFKDFQIIHNYSKTEDDRWVLDREDYYYMVKEGRKRYYGSTIAMHKDYQLDIEHPRKFFRNELRRVEKEAFERDSAYWAGTRRITLKKAELDFIHTQDSIKAYYRSDDYLSERDSIYNRLEIKDFLLNGIGFRDRKHGMRYYFNPLIAQIRPLGVGGYRHVIGGNIKKTWSKYNLLRVGGELDFGIVNRDLRGRVRVGYTYLPKRFARAYVKFGDEYKMVNGNATIAGIFARSNYIRKKHYGIGHHLEISNGLFLDTSIDFADNQAIKDLRLSQWSNNLFGGNNNPRAFDPYREFLMVFKLRWVPGQKYYMEPYRKVIVGSKWPVFEFTYKKAIPGIFDSEINFDFFQVKISDEFRPGTMGISRWAVKIGSYIQENNIRFTDHKFFRGSDPYLFANPLEAFQLLGNTISTTNEYMQVNYLHDFSGALISKIPLLKHTPLQVTGGAGMLTVPDQNFFHSEIYGGIQFPFRILKQRLKAGAYYVTSYSTNIEGAIQGQVKFGLTFFDTWKNRWEY